MTSPFKQKIRLSLGNASLQAALDDNAVRRRAARLAAFESLEENSDVVRQRAHDIRKRVIENLDGYLEEFIDRAQANGLEVHRAIDASQAVNLVLEIIHQTGGKNIVKSKTMIGEELEINTALEKAGCQVTETDLGEWLVQLRGERPAHLLTPAVHLNRKDVAQLFKERFGLAYTEDIGELTAFARTTLRQVFLRADVGISGVNFGVAENGALCLVTNEGNGRMATTLPRVHIALMGIERLVPSMEDLCVMLAVLPRASSGQKMSVYTSLIRQPRQIGEADGAIERHIILIDNGRSFLRGSPINDILFCIRCGSCLNACPVFREIGGHAYVGANGHPTPYSGPIGSVLSAGLFGTSEFTNLARASSLCGACQEACPVDIPLPDLLLRVRAGLTHPKELQEATNDRLLPRHSKTKPTGIPTGLKLGLSIFGWLASSPHRFQFSQKLAGRITRWLLPRSNWLDLPAFTGWGYCRSLPAPAHQTFQARWSKTNRLNGKTDKTEFPQFEKIAQRDHPPKKSGDLTPAILSKELLIDRFRLELEAAGGRFIACQRDQLIVKLHAELKAQDIDTLLSWEKTHLPEGVLDSLKNMTIEVTHFPEPKAAGGLTGALAAAADTGTLLLAGGTGRPLTASLMPPVHLVILYSHQIQSSLVKALNLPQVRTASYLTMITGPSRTADIEMSLTIGVHGPREVIVFCINEDN